MYQNYIFDLYGTLVDINTNEGKPYLWKKTAELYAYHGAHYTPAEFKKAYLLSNAQEMFTKHEMIALGIYDKFDGIVFSSDEGLCKPEEKFFRTVVERYGLNINECIMIGNDAGTDIKGANLIGMDSLYIHSDISPKITDLTGADIPATYKIMDGDFTKIRELVL